MPHAHSLHPPTHQLTRTDLKGADTPILYSYSRRGEFIAAPIRKLAGCSENNTAQANFDTGIAIGCVFYPFPNFLILI